MANLLQDQSKRTGIMTAVVCAVSLCTLGTLPLHADGGSGPNLEPCPRLQAPAGSGLLQPMRIQPSAVKAKNALGCLSPDDAVYGPDGCPVRFCSKQSGVISLPSSLNSAP